MVTDCKFQKSLCQESNNKFPWLHFNIITVNISFIRIHILRINEPIYNNKSTRKCSKYEMIQRETQSQILHWCTGEHHYKIDGFLLLANKDQNKCSGIMPVQAPIMHRAVKRTTDTRVKRVHHEGTYIVCAHHFSHLLRKKWDNQTNLRRQKEWWE